MGSVLRWTGVPKVAVLTKEGQKVAVSRTLLLTVSICDRPRGRCHFLNCPSNFAASLMAAWNRPQVRTKQIWLQKFIVASTVVGTETVERIRGRLRLKRARSPLVGNRLYCLRDVL